jgi:hypothetical protein
MVCPCPIQPLSCLASDGSVLVLNSVTWKSSVCCLMASSITSLAWTSPIDFLFSTQSQSTLQAVHVSATRPLDAPAGQSPQEEIYPSASPTPLSLVSHLQSFLAKEGSPSDHSPALVSDQISIERIRINCSGNLLAVSFLSGAAANSSLPSVGLFLYSSRPFLSLCLLRSCFSRSHSSPR